MATLRVKLTFPEKLVKEPVVYRLGKDFDIITNIRRANVEQKVGWIVLELEAPRENLDRGLAYLRDIGVGVDSADVDAVEG